MKKYLTLPLIALLLLTTSVFISCAKLEHTPAPAIAETASTPDQEMVDSSEAPEAELAEKPHSPEAELAEKPHSPEADAGDKSHSPEAELKDKPHSPEADAGDKSHSPEAELKDKPHSPEAELKDRSAEKHPKQLLLKIGNPAPGEKVGTFHLNGVVVQSDEISERLLNAPEEQKDMLIISMGREVPHEQVIQVMDVAKKAGINKIGFHLAERAQETETLAAQIDDTTPKTETESESKESTQPSVEEVTPTVGVSDDSVLHLIPEQTLGLVYCPSLLELDYRINTLVTDLIPTDEAPEVLASLLADIFGAGFESLAELEEIGLDLNQDFAIFMTTLEPPALSAIVHLTDPEAMKQVIDAESEGSAPTEYNGATYWSATGGDGHFAILENMLVFSQSTKVCEGAIDAFKGTKPSIVTNSDYSEFLTDIVERDAQVALHFNLESVAPLMIASLERESESMRDSMESDPSAMAVAPFIQGMFGTAINLLEQLETLNATLEVKGTDVQLAPSLKFKNGSEIQQSLKKMIPDELVILNDLPNLAVVNGAYQMDAKLLVDMNMIWLKMFSTGVPEHQNKIDALTQQIKTFYESLSDELGFSLSFSDSIIPDYLIVYGVKDKQQAQSYMENTFLDQFDTTIRIMRDVLGDSPGLNIYDGAHAGDSMMHNEVEIKSYVFPNFGLAFEQVPPEIIALFRMEWQWYYAFHEDQLFFATGSAELIKAALDRKSGMDVSLAENPSYQKLIESLGTDNNVLFALSPITLVKSLIPIVSKADPNAAAMMQMFAGIFMNMPENYSIGFSARAQDNSVDVNLLLTLGDFKQAIEMIMMMQSMGQM